MRGRVQLVLVLFALATTAPAEIIDRILATVNGVPITASEWDDAVHFEALLAGRAPDAVTAEDRQAALERLIDQALIEQQIRSSKFAEASDEEVTAHAADLRRQLTPSADDTAWQKLLANYGLTEMDLRERIHLQVDELRFVEQRFRPTVRVSSGEIARYYRDDFVPKVRKAGAEPRPLSDVSAQIEQLLAEQQVNALMAAWLQNLRTQAQIAYHDAPAAAAKPRPQENTGH